MAIQKFSVSGDEIRDFVIYAEPANINYFLDSDLTPDALGEAILESVTMPARSRRAYPGDAAAVTVAGSQAVFLRDPSRSSGNALPGRPFVLKEILEGDDLGEPGEMRQFTFVGAISDLVSWVRQNTTKRLDLYSPRGAKYKINAEEDGE